ncbi:MULTISPECIES: phosphatase PAP2 family protein [Burkholderia cepacia complex]|uniref:phosphatase PAP2 family protein n=1 Tax=Burkholderia cepacia complex TaxID=87882 RepID=UPI00097C4CF9|nr:MULTISPECIES: phosphatase PAP2 family protein [Burkholderia cepacia complex]ONJ04290.1 undecaprenyl-diphosphatase [Burkholderia cenocepacia]ONJ09592.1 undecaprenyl-diphosphatase [Burkholderia cenocepacia]ONJ29414.1 undecaprenyl-diphosphatase [Burkholderia cenocepacia]ONY69130.1 undecaprenyl-diphosphatase [Burkholderia cenocepacia]ONY73380.1 undecaprenyl-diphosphatase [Burkholderia cenocepacia]
MNTLEAFNQSLFLIINATPATPRWLIESAILIAADLIYLIPILLTAIWLCGNEVQRNLAIHACAVAIVGLGANQLIGLVWQHPRPFMIGLGYTPIRHASDSSFPSDHATVFAAIALTLLAGGARRWGGVILVCGCAVAWARVFLGVHFPLDMFGALMVSWVAKTVTTPIWDVVGEPLTLATVCIYRRLLARPIALGWLRR